MKIATEGLTRIGPEVVIGCDSLQWILFRKRTDLPGALTSKPLAFCRSKAGVERVIAESGLELSSEGRTIIDALPATFEQARQMADAGQWIDED